MSAKKLCVFTGTRAEYGLLKGLITGIAADPRFELQLIVTGTHLSPEFGMSCREIEQDGFLISRKIEILSRSDTPLGVAQATGRGLCRFAEALAELQPDLIILLGDRSEILAAAVAALILGIPIAHLHGGESTEGSIDEAMRHAITKLSALHFVAAEPYRERVIRMGEAPEQVFLVGGLGVDAILRTQFAPRTEVEKSLGFTFGPRNLVITFHPATADDGDLGRQCDELLAVLDELDNVQLIFTFANADAGGRAINARIEEFVARHAARSTVFASLGSRLYLSCMRLSDGVVGNSSSGLLEAPTLHIGTVNIGDRQKGRLRAASVIDCPPERNAIGQAIKRLYDPAFRSMLPTVRNPYGEGGATDRILDVLRRVSLSALKRKTFDKTAGHSPANVPLERQ